MKAINDYGMIYKHMEYRVLSEGFDYIKVKARGKIIYAPWWVFYHKNPKFQED